MYQLCFGSQTKKIGKKNAKIKQKSGFFFWIQNRKRHPGPGAIRKSEKIEKVQKQNKCLFLVQGLRGPHGGLKCSTGPEKPFEPRGGGALRSQKDPRLPGEALGHQRSKKHLPGKEHKRARVLSPSGSPSQWASGVKFARFTVFAVSSRSGWESAFRKHVGGVVL